MKIILKITFLFLLVSCTRNQGTISHTEYSNELETAQKSAQRISFEKLDASQYWSWLEPDTPPEESIDRFMFESDPDKIIQLTEQLHVAKTALDENPNLLTKTIWLEYQFFTHMYLSSLHRRNAGDANHDSFDLILDNQIKAVEYIDRLIEEDSEYETDRAFPELELKILTCWESADNECFEGFHDMLNKYNNTPFGPYPEYFSTTFILPGMSTYFSDTDNEILHQNYIQVLEQLSDQPDYTGISASLHLAKGYLIERELEMAEDILSDIPAAAKQVSEENHDLPADLQRFYQQMSDVYNHLSDEETGDAMLHH